MSGTGSMKRRTKHRRNEGEAVLDQNPLDTQLMQHERRRGESERGAVSAANPCANGNKLTHTRLLFAVWRVSSTWTKSLKNSGNSCAGWRPAKSNVAFGEKNKGESRVGWEPGYRQTFRMTQVSTYSGSHPCRVVQRDSWTQKTKKKTKTHACTRKHTLHSAPFICLSLTWGEQFHFAVSSNTQELSIKIIYLNMGMMPMNCFG